MRCQNDPSLLHVFVNQVLNPESNVAETEEVQKTAKQFLVGQKAGSVVHRERVWTILRGLRPTQNLPEHIPMFQRRYQMDVKMFEQGI